MKRTPWRLIVAAGILLATLAWFFWPRVPLADRASSIYLDRLLAGDTNWVYDHAFDREKAIPGFSREIVREFYMEYLSELQGVKITGAPSAEINGTRWKRQVMTAQVVTPRGRNLKLGVLAFGEDGEMRVGAIESMLYLASDLRLSAGKGKLKLSDVTPWLLSHGMRSIYLAQMDEVRELTEK